MVVVEVVVVEVVGVAVEVVVVIEEVIIVKVYMYVRTNISYHRHFTLLVNACLISSL